ncbi:MAG: homoserine dehydrogenase [Gammaproteobacteria bacterium]|nr:homoserine dehydrogenase [Gammaproteobacteria bacterium]
MQPLRIGLCGLGTVAQGVLAVLKKNQQSIDARAGREIRVARVASRTARPELDLLGAQFSTELNDVIEASDVDVVVEMIGGEDAALKLVRRSLELGKPVVTANKAIIAAHGNELLALASSRQTTIGFEATVAGGIPIIASLMRALAGNEIQWLAGIINGTSNYILTAMAESGQAFDTALAEAQRLGYAEADPTLDVEGIDAAHKLTIMAALAFGIGFRFADVYTEGINAVSVEDIEYARQLGYQVKHLGIGRISDAGVELRVHPTLVPQQQLLASVNGVMNAILVNGNAAGDTLYYGAGAGALPTASAVIADLIDIARGLSLPPIATSEGETRILSIEDVECGYFLKIPSLDKPGVFAKVATILSDQKISIEAAIQKEQAIHAESQHAWVPIIILTQRVREGVMNQALEAVQQLPEVVGEITRLRVEQFVDA